MRFCVIYTTGGARDAFEVSTRAINKPSRIYKWVLNEERRAYIQRERARALNVNDAYMPRISTLLSVYVYLSIYIYIGFWRARAHIVDYPQSNLIHHCPFDRPSYTYIYSI